MPMNNEDNECIYWNNTSICPGRDYTQFTSKTHTKCLGENASVLANERPGFVILTNQSLAVRAVTGCDGSVVARSGSWELR